MENIPPVIILSHIFIYAFRRAKIIPDDKIITSFAYLVIEGVPLPLVVPFGFFPNRRGQASGILFPSFTESAQRGFGLERGGFYWGINDYVDLELRGDIFSRGSWASTLRSTYNVRYRYRGGFTLGYSSTVRGERGLPDYGRFTDFRIAWNHNQDPKARPNSTFSASVNAGSSNFNRLNRVSDQEYLSNTMQSSISWRGNWAGMYNLSANLGHSQNTLTRQVSLRLPEIAFTVNRFHPLRRSQPVGTLAGMRT
jgi:lipopolysaccharide assembly outer membrane protein LptD (OstA)